MTHSSPGNIIKVWTAVRDSLIDPSNKSSKLHITRARLDDGRTMVGIEVPRQCVDSLIQDLAVSRDR